MDGSGRRLKVSGECGSGERWYVKGLRPNFCPEHAPQTSTAIEKGPQSQKCQFKNKDKGSRGDGGLSFLRMEEVLGSSRKR